MSLNNTNLKDDTPPFVHLWLRYNKIKHLIHPTKLAEDEEKWVELADDNLDSKMSDIFGFGELRLIVIERKQKMDPYWPRAKGDDWRKTLQVGDIIDCRDKQDKWYESQVIFIHPSDSDKYGKCIVHYIGWHSKWDEEIDINSDRLNKRHSKTKGPRRPSYYY